MTRESSVTYNVGMSTVVSPVASKAEVVALLRQHAETIRSLGVERIGLFGSFVREEQTPESDVDILIDFREEEATFDNFMDLCFLLEDHLGRKVEVLTAKYLSPYIGPHILREVEYVSLDN